MMNKNLRELSNIAYENHLRRNPHSSFGRREDYDKEFAELIVQECAQYVEDKFDFCGDEIVIAEKLREHFGVK
jgi:hypothetical protein